MGIIDGIKSIFNMGESKRRSQLGVGVSFWDSSQSWFILNFFVAIQIDIGKNAVLRTDVSEADFFEVVNIMSGDKVAVDSGLTGELDAEFKDGDIILKATPNMSPTII